MIFTKTETVLFILSGILAGLSLASSLVYLQVYLYQ
jgi:hypothetical protein